MASRYPAELESRQQLADGSNICIRPIRPEDAEIEQSFIRRLSAKSKYFRFMSSLVELTPAMLKQFTQIDYDREMAFIAATEREGAEVEIGVARYVPEPDGETCEFAIVVADEWHGKGVGSLLMRALMRVASARGLKTMRGEVLGNNSGMLRLMRSLDFTIATSTDDPGVEVAKRRLQ